MKVGVFDSGVGGISVLSSLIEHKIFKEIIYYGDTARVPYGTKDKRTIIKYAIEALNFFETQKIDVLIFACNSVSAYAIDIIRKKTKIKVFGVIKAGIKACTTNSNRNSNILIIGTKATIQSNKYQNGLKKLGYKNLQAIATPLFVPIIEENISGKILDETLKYYFQKATTPDIVILGCTHYPFIQKEISQYFSNAKTIHSGEAIANRLIKKLQIEKNLKLKKVKFYASDNIESLKTKAISWIDSRFHKYFEFNSSL